MSKIQIGIIATITAFCVAAITSVPAIADQVLAKLVKDVHPGRAFSSVRATLHVYQMQSDCKIANVKKYKHRDFPETLPLEVGEIYLFEVIFREGGLNRLSTFKARHQLNAQAALYQINLKYDKDTYGITIEENGQKLHWRLPDCVFQ